MFEMDSPSKNLQNLGYTAFEVMKTSVAEIQLEKPKVGCTGKV